jgi:hypothetical protein
MKHTTIESLLSRELLCFVRDQAPTIEEFLGRFGGAGGKCFHTLRKSGAVEVESGRVQLDPRLLSPDGQCFAWRSSIICMDRDEVLHVYYGPTGPPASPWESKTRTRRTGR